MSSTSKRGTLKGRIVVAGSGILPPALEKKILFDIKNITEKGETKMRFQPLNDRVLVEVIHADEVTASGLFIPEQAKEKPQQGRVISVGEGGYINGVFRPTALKVGDTVLFGKFAGSQIKINGQDRLILMEDDIFGKLEEA